MSTKLETRPAAKLPAEVADVALVAVGTCAAIGEVSVSWWHEEVRAGRAPKPAIQQPRFSRWRLADVKAYWAARIAQADAAAGERAAAKARHASAAAQTPQAIAKAQATRAARREARAGGAA